VQEGLTITIDTHTAWDRLLIMKKYVIHEWNKIEKHFSHRLVLGNGASIAVWDGFDYYSLYNLAEEAGRLEGGLKELFADFKTNDFEYILKLLQQIGACTLPSQNSP
jgi:uncharacterized protein affecting Mg2+/Co2+ transport